MIYEEKWTFENSVIYYNLGHKPANFEEFSVAFCLQKNKIPFKLHLLLNIVHLMFHVTFT